uniref:Uncharacterized protein n=1 Tax=Solanum lycopersicum TaxID=4081 RepID=A0A3Q7HYE5_SOLLC
MSTAIIQPAIRSQQSSLCLRVSHWDEKVNFQILGAKRVSSFMTALPVLKLVQFLYIVLIGVLKILK